MVLGIIAGAAVGAIIDRVTKKKDNDDNHVHSHNDQYHPVANNSIYRQGNQDLYARINELEYQVGHLTSIIQSDSYGSPDHTHGQRPTTIDWNRASDYSHGHDYPNHDRGIVISFPSGGYISNNQGSYYTQSHEVYQDTTQRQYEHGSTISFNIA